MWTNRGATTIHTNVTTRFHFLPPKPAVKSKKKKKSRSNENARRQHYDKINKKADEYEKRINFFKPRGKTSTTTATTSTTTAQGESNRGGTRSACVWV